MIPYSTHSIDDDDVEAVVEALRSGWLTTGPAVEAFEGALAEFTGAGHAVALSSGTAGLHAVVSAFGIGPGDEVIVPPMTFAATANCVLHAGGRPVFADVSPETLLLKPEKVEEKISPRTKAVIAVDYAGHPCDYEGLRRVTRRHGLALIADSCHALGAEYRGVRTGTLADATVFSFHPVKHITTGEGGAVTTDRADIADHVRAFRNHGITADFRQRAELKTWRYDIAFLGCNYRISDFQCALGSSQLKKLPAALEDRRAVALQYDRFFDSLRKHVTPLSTAEDVLHARHLYVVRLNAAGLRGGREGVFTDLREGGIGVNVHYVPVYLHSLYRDTGDFGAGLCPVAEAAYEEILSLPLYPGLSTGEVDQVCDAVLDTLRRRSL